MRSGAGSTTSQPRHRKKQRSIFGTFVRIAAFIVIIGALVFVVAGFYYSGEIRDGGLTPSTSYDHEYLLSISDVSGDLISVTDTGSNDQIGQPGFEGIEWSGGYITTSKLVPTTSTDSGDRIDVRQMIEGSIPPAEGTDARLDSYVFAQDPDRRSEFRLRRFDIHRTSTASPHGSSTDHQIRGRSSFTARAPTSPSHCG